LAFEALGPGATGEELSAGASPFDLKLTVTVLGRRL